MALGYASVYRQVALRVNAIAGTDASTINTNYAASISSGDSVIAPFSFIKDCILSAESTIAHAIAASSDHPYRSYLHATTADLAYNAAMPSTSSASDPIIGSWGAVKDSSTGIECTEQPANVIKLIVRNLASGTLIDTNYHYAKIHGNRILHTRTNVKVDVCIYNRTTRQTAIDGSGAVAGNSVLPDALDGLLVCGAVAMIVRDDEFERQASIYRNYFESGIAQLIQGGIPMITAPSPSNSPDPATA